MAGNSCNGGTYPTAGKLVNSLAYCEGRQAAATGAADTTNPHAAGSEANACWDAGHVSYSADPAGVANTQDCCAIAYGAGYTP